MPGPIRVSENPDEPGAGKDPEEEEAEMPPAPAPRGENGHGGDESGDEPSAPGDAGPRAHGPENGEPAPDEEAGTGEGAVEDPVPTAQAEKISVWAPMAADTSHVERPEPEDVDLRTPILLFLAPIVLLAIGSLVARDLVWDSFLDPYVWDFIVRDEGFNAVNTGMWALLLGLLLFVAFRLVQKIEQPVDFVMILATVPYMIGGAIVRVMEDTGYFGEPLRFFFITPIIYVMIFGVAVLWLVIGRLLRAQAENVGPEPALRSLAGLFGVVWVLYFAWTLYGGDDVVSQFANPWVVLLAFVVPLVYFWAHTRQSGRFTQTGVMAAFGSVFMLTTLYMLVSWHVAGSWDPLVDKPLPQDPSTNLWVYPVMLALSGVFIAIIYLIARGRAATSANALVFLLPVNLLVIFGQTWDALSTSIGIDFIEGYEEKHWLPGLLMDGLEGLGLPVLSDYSASFVMIPLKIAVAFAVVYLIDVYSKADMVKYPDLVGLVKLAIIMVGLVPGTRNAIRMAMGI